MDRASHTNGFVQFFVAQSGSNSSKILTLSKKLSDLKNGFKMFIWPLVTKIFKP